MFSSEKLLENYDESQRDYIDKLIKSDESIAAAWFEKFRRFSSIYGRRLKKISKKRFGSNSKIILNWIIKWLFFASDLDKNRNDHSYLNAILYCNEALNNAYENEINHKLRKLLKNISSINIPEEINTYGKEIEFEKKLFISLESSSIVIFAPTVFSHFAIVIFDQLIKLNLKPSLIVVRKLTIKRFFNEFKRDGIRIISKKIWRKLILKKNENNSQNTFGTIELINYLKIKESNLKKFSNYNKVKFLEVDNFSDIDGILNEIKPDYGIFTGGGMIDSSTLNKFNEGIINTHMGPLPIYRGMDVVQAPILDGKFCNISLTTHFMAKQLDQGDVLSKMTFDSRSYNDLESLRNELSASQPVLALYTLVNCINSKLIAIKQDKSHGKQYYFIHEKLQKILKKIMLNFFNNSTKKKNLRNLFSKILIK